MAVKPDSSDDYSCCYEVDVSDIKPESLARMLRETVRHMGRKPGSAAKMMAKKDSDEYSDSPAKGKMEAAEGESEDNENDDLVELSRATRGDGNPPKVLNSDLPSDLARAMKKGKTRG